MRKLIAVLLLAAPLTASAQTRHAAPRAEPPPRAQHLDIDDDEPIEGDTARGEADLITVRQRPRHKSLIRIRENFNPEMLRTALRL
jgi:hypothetical protein